MIRLALLANSIQYKFKHVLSLSSTTLHTNLREQAVSTLVVAEPSETSLLTPSTLSTITAAQKLHSGPISILSLSSSPLETSYIPKSIFSILRPKTNLTNILAETVTTVITAAHSKYSYSHIVGPSTKFGSSLLCRLAAMLDVSPLTDVIEVLGNDTFVKPTYAGNVLCKVEMDSSQLVKVVSFRPTAFSDIHNENLNSSLQMVDLNVNIPSSPLIEFVSKNENKSNRPELSSAKIVISGGRGMRSSENFALLEQLAEKFDGKAAVGATRAAVDAGYVSNDLQVGQTGKNVSPELYIAVGVSGAIQHLSGMKDSKNIVAINNDPDAPIFQVADYGLVEDLFKALPELIDKLG